MKVGMWCIVAALNAGPVLAQSDSWRQQIDEGRGYTSEQSNRLHALFDLASWQITTDNQYARYTLLRTNEFFPAAVIPRSGAIRVLKEVPRPDIGGVVSRTETFGSLRLDDYL